MKPTPLHAVSWKSWRLSRRAVLVGLLVGGVLSGCVAKVGAPGGGSSGQTCGPASARRLTNVQYDNTVRDLLGDTSHPSRSFPADTLPEASFADNVTSLTLPSALVTAYEGSAQTLIASAWTRDATATAPALKVCDPAKAGQDACSRQILQTFAKKAWRRPVTADEVNGLLALLPVAAAHGDSWEQGMKLALSAVLLSPNFLFRMEPNATADPALKPYALASRLSYFLWSSTPDDALLALADRGTLSDPQVLKLQVQRMLADPKAQALVETFIGQWLNTQGIQGVSPDATLFPDITPALKRSMQAETESFMSAFLREDRSLTEMLDANFTYLDDTLAGYYGLPAPGSATPVRVTLPPGQRQGLLTQAGVLSLTSLPTRTSPVRRGKYVLERLLCRRPPPPPPNVPKLPNTLPPGATLRQTMEAHSQNPACSGCHAQMDPIGFGFEHFDAVGKWREQDNGQPVDAAAILNGQPFDGALALSALLKADPALPSCIVQKAFSFAVGRDVAAVDVATLQQLAASFATHGNRLAQLLTDVATSPSFTGACTP